MKYVDVIIPHFQNLTSSFLMACSNEQNYFKGSRMMQSSFSLQILQIFNLLLKYREKLLERKKN